ncbi:MAG: WXG100 family type VII secretion target [Ilumatobacteraceae bacterium]
MSVSYGAVPEQLTSLGRSLKQQITSIEQVMSTVTSALGGTTWSGPARDQFENDWNNSFRTALNKLNQAFDAAGSDCMARSTDLQRVMGAR